MLAIALDTCMLGLRRYFLGSTVLYEVHPDFSTSIYPVGSIDATRFVFRLGLLLPLVNNHIRLVFMRSAIYDTVILDIWSCTLWYAGLYSTRVR